MDNPSKILSFMKSDEFEKLSKHFMEEIIPRGLRGVVAEAPIRKCQKKKFLQKINRGLNVAQPARGFVGQFLRRKT
jgi:hypothetical protein